MAPAPLMLLRPGEEDWRDVFDRLKERFPSVPAEKVAQLLRENSGHAGNTAGALRHLTGDGVVEPEPDDAEHVATLLSSPAMFKHVCKEHFKKFDMNGDGVLQYPEVLGLTNELYQNFGLQQPSEGSLRAFFDATDDNNDGVLSEREFRKFFECFLRYAYFDVMKLRQMVEKGRAKRANSKEFVENGKTLSTERVSPPSSSEDVPEPEVPRKPRSSPKARTAAPEPLEEAVRHQRGKDTHDVVDHNGHRDHAHHKQQSLRCIADGGVPLCKSPDLQDTTGVIVKKGQTVPVLEMWVKTADGWLPVSDPNGGVLFDRAHDSERKSRADRHHASEAKGANTQHRNNHSTGHHHHHQAEATATGQPEPPQQAAHASRSQVESGPAGKLAANEADWQDRFDRLRERFPNCTAAQVLTALRDHDGHAGQAAAALRDL